MDNNQKIVRVLEKIQEALNDVRDLYPAIPKGLLKIINKVGLKSYIINMA